MKLVIFLFILLAMATETLNGQELTTYPPYYFSYSRIDSVEIPPVYPDQAMRDSVESLYSEHWTRIFQVESFNLKRQGIDFMKREDSLWHIRLTNGENMDLVPEKRYGIRHYIFEQYYAQEELIAFKIVQYEGGGYRILDRNTGKSIWTEGPPIFSPDRKFFLSISGDFGYLDMVIRLFQMTNQGPVEILAHDQSAEPLQAKWRDNTSFYLGLREWPKKSFTYYLFEIRKTGD